jgi:hypothetical protein
MFGGISSASLAKQAELSETFIISSRTYAIKPRPIREKFMHCRKNNRIAPTPLLLAFCFAIVLFLGGTSQAQQPKAIKALLEERLATITKSHDLAVKRFWMLANGSSGDQVLRAKSILIATQLELSDTNDQRIIHYENMLKDAEKWEARLTNNQAALGERGTLDVLEAKAFRLGIQIALEKAKQPKK